MLGIRRMAAMVDVAKPEHTTDSMQHGAHQGHSIAQRYARRKRAVRGNKRGPTRVPEDHRTADSGRDEYQALLRVRDLGSPLLTDRAAKSPPPDSGATEATKAWMPQPERDS